VLWLSLVFFVSFVSFVVQPVRSRILSALVTAKDARSPSMFRSGRVGVDTDTRAISRTRERDGGRAGDAHAGFAISGT